MSWNGATWLAIGALCGAAVALCAAVWAFLLLRRVRAAQLVLLGGGKADLVDFAVSLQGRIDDLHRAVDELAAALSRVDQRVDLSLARTGLVRYDAYKDAGGQQSASVALLNSGRTGVVLSAVQGRDYAPVYLKELDRGRASGAPSPGELGAGERALAGEKP